MVPTKTRWPRAVARAVADEIVRALEPACVRIVIAGSLRRGKAEVGDAEILYIPRFEERTFDLFSSKAANVAEEVISGLLISGVLSQRASKTGSFSWGAKNKLALHRTGVPVDLFAATAENWWNYLVCRTGPADLNQRICMAAQSRGWKWNPYGAGFSRDGETRAMASEAEVFAFVGLPYAPPEDRR